MMRHRSKQLHQIVDGLPTHKTKLVKQCLQSTKGRLSLYFLPGYTPDLNPDELIWSPVKRTGLVVVDPS
jgi:transposase